MAYKFKLKEAPAPNLAKQGGYKVGDVTFGMYSNVNNHNVGISRKR